MLSAEEIRTPAERAAVRKRRNGSLKLGPVRTGAAASLNEAGLATSLMRHAVDLLARRLNVALEL